MNSGLPFSKAPRAAEPFQEFHPVFWNPAHPEAGEVDRGIYSIRRNHGISGSYKLHNLNDAINDDRPTSEKTLIEYRINGCSYSIFTVADLLEAPYSIDQTTAGSIMGDLAERIARRVTKYFLKHWSKRGYSGGIFDKRFDPLHRDDFIVGSTNDYVLKIDHYPNLIILKRTGRGKFGYENIRELDGFFDYRYGGRRYICVLESKLEKINVSVDDLAANCFTPLRELFPEARFYYVLFTDKNSIYVKSAYRKWRQIKQQPVRLCERLSRENVGSLFFSFNESREDFERMKDFLILQYAAVRNREVTLFGKTVISEKDLLVFDGGETPHIKLVKDSRSGLWREVKLRHKRIPGRAAVTNRPG